MTGRPLSICEARPAGHWCPPDSGWTNRLIHCSLLSLTSLLIRFTLRHSRSSDRGDDRSKRRSSRAQEPQESWGRSVPYGKLILMQSADRLLKSECMLRWITIQSFSSCFLLLRNSNQGFQMFLLLRFRSSWSCIFCWWSDADAALKTRFDS